MMIVQKGRTAHRQNHKMLLDVSKPRGQWYTQVMDPSGRSICGRVVGVLVETDDAPALGIRKLCRSCCPSLAFALRTARAIGLPDEVVTP